MEATVVSSFFSNTDGLCADSDTTSSESLCNQFLGLMDELNLCLEEFKVPSKVPFGEISSVRDWLGIEGPVGKPPVEHPARPVKGFEGTRLEISGKRFWGLFKELCGTPETFFETSFVYNYLPQQWLNNNGGNVTTRDCRANELKLLYNICDRTLSKVLALYEVEKVIAIGEFCKSRAKNTLKQYSTSKTMQIILMPHPSPRVKNNNNWEQKANECLKNNNLQQLYQHT